MYIEIIIKSRCSYLLARLRRPFPRKTGIILVEAVLNEITSPLAVNCSFNDEERLF
jgi:hypothetical protein